MNKEKTAFLQYQYGDFLPNLGRKLEKALFQPGFKNQHPKECMLYVA